MMFLKLMWLNKGVYNQDSVELSIKKFIDDCSKNEDVNYSSYLSEFKFDRGVSDYVRVELLKLVKKLLVKDLSQRIPFKLFGLLFLQVFNIKSFNLSTDGDSEIDRNISYDIFIKRFNSSINSINEADMFLRACLDPKTMANRSIDSIFRVIKDTLDQRNKFNN